MSEGPGRRRATRLAAALLGAALTGVAVGAITRVTTGADEPAGGTSTTALHGQATWPAGERAAAPFALHDQSGRPVSLASLRGRTVLLTFLDSRCVDACPLAGRALAEVERRVTGPRPLLAVVGLNPEGDTAASVRTQTRRWGWQPGWLWLNGTRGDLQRVWRSYGIAVRPRASAIDHDAAVYLVDRAGFVRAGYLVPFSPLVLARDVERIASGTD